MTHSNVWDFEAVMRARLDPGHVAYLAQGSDDLGTIAANRAGFKKIGLGRGGSSTSATPICQSISSANA